MPSHPPRPFSPAVTQNGTRSSTDSEPSVFLNGTAHHHDDPEQDLDMDPLERVQRQLARERAEKEDLATQHRNLLAKLTTMRTTLGNKLKQDAVRPSVHVYGGVAANTGLIGRARPPRAAHADADGAE